MERQGGEGYPKGRCVKGSAVVGTDRITGPGLNSQVLVYLRTVVGTETCYPVKGTPLGRLQLSEATDRTEAWTMPWMVNGNMMVNAEWGHYCSGA